MKYLLILCFILFTFTSFALPNELSKILNATENPHAPYWIDATDDLLDISKDYADFPIKQLKKERTQRNIGDTEKFWTTVVTDNSFEEIEATLRVIGKHCYIYVANDQNVNNEILEKLKNQFDNNIYLKDTYTFGSEPNPGVDFDKRITFLLLNIKDGWKPGKGYVGGYFFPLNEYSKRIFQYSNEREMFYIDTYPGNPESPFTLSVIAHEFQHMIHWNQDPKEKIWFNEACSQYAMWNAGYGHANQIFATIRNPKLDLTAWAKDVMLENYGMVYLWNYYLFRKYGGNNEQEIQKFIKNLVANQDKGMEAIEKAIAPNSIKDIFKGFCVANFANNIKNDNKYKYDETLTMTLHPNTTVSSFPFIKQENEVLKWSSNCIQFVSEAPYMPINPTLIDKITFTSEKPGKLYWGVNNWNTPDNEYIPSRSELYRFGVETNLEKNNNGNYICELGAFRKNVKNINFIFKYDDGTTSDEYNVPIIQSSLNYRENKGTKLNISFKGKNSWFSKPELYLYAVCSDSLNKNAKPLIKEIKIDPSLNAHFSIKGFGANYNNVKLIVINTKGKGKYSVSATLTTEEFNKDYMTSLKYLKKYADSTRNINDNNYLKIIDRINYNIDILKENKNIDALNIINKFFNNTKNDDSDTSHTNINYLIFKNEEMINALTHLKIDPVWLEGQIKDMLTLLEINLHWPHIPFPNGLALKSYNLDKAKEYIAKLKENYNDHDKEILKRLTIAETIMETGYNNSLIMAEDMSSGLYKTVALFFNAKKSIEFALSKLENIPIIGGSANYVKKKLIEKITIASNKVIKLASNKLPSPYNTIVPIASDIITKVIFHFQDIDPEDTSSVGTMKNIIIKTAGKYVLSSIPKIGFVPSTQKFIDEACLKAENGKISADHKTALNTVIEAQNSYSNKLILKTQNSHNRVKKDWQIADISSSIADIAQYTSIIDPTAISKIVTILGKVLSGGLLGHSIYIAGNNYYAEIPENMHLGVCSSFFPNRNYDLNKNSKKYNINDRQINIIRENISSISNDLEKSITDYKNIIKNNEFKNIDNSIITLCNNISKYDDMLEIIGSYITNSNLSRSRTDKFSKYSMNSTTIGINIYAETLLYFKDNTKNKKDNLLLSLNSFENSIKNTNRFLNNNIDLLRSSSTSIAIISTDYPQWVKANRKFKVSYKIKNCSPIAIKNIKINYGTGTDVKLNGKRTITIKKINPYTEIPISVYFTAEKNNKLVDMSIIAEYNNKYETEILSTKCTK